MGELATFVPLVAVALLFWLMIVRPASRRQKAVARLQADLRPGQRVMLTSGVYATVRSLSDDRARVEIAPGTEIEVVRAAIGAIDEPAAPTDPSAGSSTEPTAESGDGER